MCGIVGARDDWLRRQARPAATAMQAAVGTMAWRGPDEQHVQSHGSWWLGCARLAISRADSSQPVVRRGGRFAAVMNGAITNARELWATLCPGTEHRPQLLNDTWLPLLAAERNEPEMLAKLRGHHALAVVDAERDELWIAQDRFGEKPLHCLIERTDAGWQLVAFASTTDALMQLGMPRVDAPRRLAELLRFGWSADRPHRFSSRLQRCSLPTRGVAFLSTNDGANWCEPLPSPGPTTPTPRASDLRERLLTSVARCTDTPVPVALALSGGLDSSCLALALGAQQTAVPAYQFCAKGAPQDERRAARAVAQAAGLPLHEVTAGSELLDELPRLTRLAGQPLGDPSILAVHAIASRAAANGARVMLGGEGADELLLGYRRYRLLSRLPRLPGRRALHGFANGWSMRHAARAFRAATAANPIRALLAVTPPAFGREALAPELIARRCWRDTEPLPPGEPRNLLALAQRDDLDHYLPRDLLPKVDIACMAAGIESRCPYLEAGIDAELAEPGKHALRAAFASELPSEVTTLRKFGFSVPLDAWFRNENPWIELLLEPRSQSRRHLRPGGTKHLIDVHRRGSADLGHAIYLLLAYELYLRSIETTDPPDSSPT